MEENNCLLIILSLLCFISVSNAMHITEKVIVILKIFINIHEDMQFFR